MMHLIDVHLVQFYLWDYETFHPSPRGFGILGANGAGKTSFGDAVQVERDGCMFPDQPGRAVDLQHLMRGRARGYHGCASGPHR